MKWEENNTFWGMGLSVCLADVVIVCLYGDTRVCPFVGA